MQVERNLHDAMGVARNVMMDPRLVPGGGAVEMAISRGLYERSASIQGTQQVAGRPAWMHVSQCEALVAKCKLTVL